MRHCSEAKRVPVRPNPVATSSAIRSTPCSRQVSPTRSTDRRIGHPHAGGALHERLDDHRGQLVGVGRDQGAGGVGPARVVVARGPQDGEAQRIEDVGAEPAGAEGDRAHGVAVVGACPSARYRVRVGDALVGPELERDLERLLHRGRAVGGEQEVRFRHRAPAAPAPRPARSWPGCRCRACVVWATRSSCSRTAWSSSGTRWPRVVTHSDEMASR